MRSLKTQGKGACILPHGVLLRGTGIPACIVVIDKEHAHTRKGIFMLDASKGFIKDGNKKRLRDCDIHRIVDVFNRCDDSNPRYARMVGLKKIEKNEYNLNIPRYIDSSEAEDKQDIAGHLHGGIPEADVDALHAYWDICPGLKTALFSPLPQAGQAATCQLAGVVDCLVVPSEGPGGSGIARTRSGTGKRFQPTRRTG